MLSFPMEEESAMPRLDEPTAADTPQIVHAPVPARAPRAYQDYVLSVVIPVYNERKTLLDILERVRAVEVPKEIILVDDGSTDGTRDLLQRRG